MSQQVILQWQILKEITSPIKYQLLLSTIGYLLASIITGHAIVTQDHQQPHTSSNNTQSSSPNNTSTNNTPLPNYVTSSMNKRASSAQQQQLPIRPLSRSDSGSPASGEVVVTSTIVFPPNRMRMSPNDGTSHKTVRLLQSSTTQTSEALSESDYYNTSYNYNNQQKGRSSGEYTRRYFYKLLLVALMTRILSLSVEAATLLHRGDGGNSQCSDNALCILSRSLPDYTFASALSLLVLFYGQLAGTASIGGPTGFSLLLTQTKNLFPIGNAVVYALYTILFAFHLVFHRLLSLFVFQRCIWFLLLVVYSVLLGLLLYFGPILVIVLRPSLAKWSGLALRLISMCLLCTIIFITRMASFAIACYTNDIQYTCGFLASSITKYFLSSLDTTSASLVYFYTRDVIGNICYELIPTFVILFMMHPRSKTAGRYPQGSSSLPSSANNTPPNPNSHLMDKPQTSYRNNNMTSYNQNNNTHSNMNHTSGNNSSTSTTTQFMRRNISGSAPKGVSSTYGGYNRIGMANHGGSRNNEEVRPLLDHPHGSRGYGIGSDGV